MIGDQNILFITDEEGNEIQMEILLTFVDPDTEKLCVVAPLCQRFPNLMHERSLAASPFALQGDGHRGVRSSDEFTESLFVRGYLK